jgi:hypothetical protein
MRVVWLVIVCLTSVAIALLSFEVLVESGFAGLPYTSAGAVDFQRMARSAAERRGDAFDPRTDLSVIHDERQQHRRVYPTVSPSWYLAANGSRISSNGVPVLPLGINAHASSYYCNESGSFAKFETDRHGLRNPDSVWEEAVVDVLIVGDSFAFGSCVEERDSIAGVIRQSFPATINTGQGANGPLLALGAIREYAVPLRARRVFWLFFENDLDDLIRERANPILPRYLDPEFSQGLIHRAGELSPLVDDAVERYLQLRLDLQLRLASSPRSREAPDRSLLDFANTRGVLRATYQRLRDNPESTPRDLELFMQIVKTARKEIQAYGGELSFVYLPDCNPANNASQIWRARLMASLREAQLTVLDGDSAITRLGSKAFYYCPGSHFTPAGASAIAKLIIDQMAVR